jgi:hypothetical protein
VDGISPAEKNISRISCRYITGCDTFQCHITELFFFKILYPVFSKKFLPGSPKNFPDFLFPVVEKPGKKSLTTAVSGMQQDSWYSGVHLLPVTGLYYRWCMVSIIMDNGIKGMYCSHDPEDDLGLFTVPAPGRMRSPQHAVSRR